jgi:hypothetical protein
VRNAIANRRLAADDPAFGLSETYLLLLATGPISPTDRTLLVDMIRDERVVEFGGLWRVTKALGKESGFLRAPIVDRIGRPGTDREAANALSGELGSLPKFELSNAERVILADPDRRSRAIGLIAAGIDNDALTNWQLLGMLGQHAARMTASKNAGANSGVPNDFEVVDTIRRGLCRRGIRARELISSLREMQSQKTIPTRITGADEWQFMLARLGVPAEQLATPPGYSRSQYIKVVTSRLDPNRSEQTSGNCV